MRTSQGTTGKREKGDEFLVKRCARRGVFSTLTEPSEGREYGEIPG